MTLTRLVAVCLLVFAGSLPARAQEGSDGSYTLFLSDEIYIYLSVITTDTLDFSSSESSRTLSCRRY